MTGPHNLFDTLKTFSLDEHKNGQFYSLPQLEKSGIGRISRLPISIRIVLESLLRNCDGKRVNESHIKKLANWEANGERVEEIPFIVSRVLLQDFTGVPVLADLAAMRSASQRLGKDPARIEPLVPVDLVVDHSIQVDFSNMPDALKLNMEIEFERNMERYRFLKWGMQAFSGFNVVPPGIGIVHQVNLEYLARGVFEKNGIYYPDTLVGTDSHTTMINGMGIVGWGVGGIEAEAAMLGQPVYFLTPDVVGVHLAGALKEGVTATDLVLTVTEMLRKAKVVGKFVEFFGEGAASLSVGDRGTIANMAPEYGATIGFFPADEATIRYLRATGRPEDQVRAFENYFKAQGLFGIPRAGQCDYSTVLELDLASIQASVAGPKRPQDRIDLANLKDRFNELLVKPVNENGYNKSVEEVGKWFPLKIGTHQDHVDQPISGGGEQGSDTVPDNVSGNSKKNTSALTEVEMMDNRPTPNTLEEIDQEFPEAIVRFGHGDVVIAAITSCTNTSNPGVMVAAGLVAKKAIEKGLRVNPKVKTSLAPGSRVVTEYLRKAGLQTYLDQLGFYLVGYGCTTCIGNSGPLDPKIEDAITQNDIIAASVLSGNRNFEARVHQSVKANFLMSPPLVVALALAGRVNIDLSTEPLGQGQDGKVYLKDIWPTLKEISEAMQYATDAQTYRRLYNNLRNENPMWNEIPSTIGKVYQWDTNSTYIQEPPFLFSYKPEPSAASSIIGARPLAVLGDSVTTDHISPAGSIKASSPAGKYLQEKNVTITDFNSYGSRRGNHEVMLRGTLANVRIKNLMVPGVEGGVTMHYPDRTQMTIYDASMQYQKEGVPLVILAGEEYGSGSSRDWAAKGTQLLGVKAVIAKSFERIHRSNLVGMGVLPCQFKDGVSAQTLNLDGSEMFDLIGLDGVIKPQQDLTLVIHRANGQEDRIPVRLRIDTPIEVDYYSHGGILPYVLKQLVA